MEIFVNGRRAALKRGSSFEYIEENRLFTDADSYTLSITFPLAGCPENIAIFGRLNRSDVLKSTVTFDCELRWRAFCRIGTLTIVEIDECELKGQFLEGRSAQNFNSSFDDIYINELDLGQWPSDVPDTPEDALSNLDAGAECVAFPWVNEQTGSVQNNMVWSSGAYAWAGTERTTPALSWQPYLIVIAERVCEEINYSHDFTPWEESMKRFLLVCNTLPSAWGMKGFAKALPHWSVTEFFEELEKILDGEFDIDHRMEKVTFRFTETVLQNKAPVRLESVIDKCQVTVSTDSPTAYRGHENRRYAEAAHSMAPYYSCDWYIKANGGSATHFTTVAAMLAATAAYATPGSSRETRYHNRLLFAEDAGRYYALRVIGQVQGSWSESRGEYVMNNVYCLQLVNPFGAYIAGEDDEEGTELHIVPVCIDYTDADNGFCMFLDPGTLSEDDAVSGSSIRQTGLTQGSPCAAIEAGEKEGGSEYYDKIYVAYWEGQLPDNGSCPFPCIDNHFIDKDWTDLNFGHTLKLLGGSQLCMYDIDPYKKFTFEFLADEIPDVRALFYIEGKRYLAEKITVTFTEEGMSKKMKGDFFMVV